MGLSEGTSKAALDRESTERFVGLRNQLGVTAFGLNQMNLEPGQRGRIHRHGAQEEVFLVIAGQLTLIVEGDEHTLGPDQAMRVAPDLKRQLVNKGPERVTLIAIGGAGEHQGRDGEAFPDWDADQGGPPQEIPLPEDLDLEG